MRIFLLILLLATASLAAPPAAGQQFYSWRDADGVRHFSDSPPPHDNYVPRQIREPRRRAAEKPDAAKPSTNAACTRARANIAVFANNDIVNMDRNNDGKPETLTEAERAYELDRAMAVSRRFCASQ